MNIIKNINDFLKIYENFNLPNFKNEKLLKDLLIQDKDFAKGEIHRSFVNIFHDYWTKNRELNYNGILNWVEQTYGEIPYFTILLSKYNYQVYNGGHEQYFENGYASSEHMGLGYNYIDINTHDTFVYLFKNLNFDKILNHGKEALDIISDFKLDLLEEEERCNYCGGDGYYDCPECEGGEKECSKCGGEGIDSEEEKCEECDGEGHVECDNCDGEGYIQCEECDGDGKILTGEKIPDTKEWNKLDSEWYGITDEIMEEFDNYLKSLYLDGEKISDLVKLAQNIQKYTV